MSGQQPDLLRREEGQGRGHRVRLGDRLLWGRRGWRAFCVAPCGHPVRWGGPRLGLWQLKSCWPCPHWLWAATVYPPGLGMRDACPLEMSFPMPGEPHTERWLVRAPFAPPRTASGAWLLYWGLFQERRPGDGVALSTEPPFASKLGGGISSRPLLPGVPCWFAGAGLKPTLEHWALQAGLHGQYMLWNLS